VSNTFFTFFSNDVLYWKYQRIWFIDKFSNDVACFISSNRTIDQNAYFTSYRGKVKYKRFHAIMVFMSIDGHRHPMIMDIAIDVFIVSYITSLGIL